LWIISGIVCLVAHQHDRHQWNLVLLEVVKPGQIESVTILFHVLQNLWHLEELFHLTHGVLLHFVWNELFSQTCFYKRIAVLHQRQLFKPTFDRGFQIEKCIYKIIVSILVELIQSGYQNRL